MTNTNGPGNVTIVDPGLYTERCTTRDGGELEMLTTQGWRVTAIIQDHIVANVPVVATTDEIRARERHPSHGGTPYNAEKFRGEVIVSTLYLLGRDRASDLGKVESSLADELERHRQTRVEVDNLKSSARFAEEEKGKLVATNAQLEKTVATKSAQVGQQETIAAQEREKNRRMERDLGRLREQLGEIEFKRIVERTER